MAERNNVQVSCIKLLTELFLGSVELSIAANLSIKSPHYNIRNLGTLYKYLAAKKMRFDSKLKKKLLKKNI